MYAYTEFDRQFVRARAAQFRDQLERHLAGRLPDEDFRALRLQNGWYVQRHAPMLRVAVPYGVLGAAQLHQLAAIARDHDRGFGHFTTRQNLQYNWIPLTQAADVMDKLAAVDLHGIQTSGNCIRNITSDALAGVAADEIVDPRPYCEVMRQWSTLHPEFAFLPRKFKIAVSGAAEDRAAIAWHDVGLQLQKRPNGEIGFRVLVGGGMGRTPITASVIREFLPWNQILCYLEAIVRVYNRYGRRDNAYKARIKILVKAEGQKYFDAVETEFARILAVDVGAGLQLIPQAEFDRIAAHFARPAGVQPVAPVPVADDAPPAGDATSLAYRRWLQRNVHAHQVRGYSAVTLSLKRAGQAPGDVTDLQMDAAARLATRYSHGELRVTHDQNLVLPWVLQSALPALFAEARDAGCATPNIGLITDMINCPGGDFCALANARSIPVAAAITERFADLDEVHDIGDIDLHISGCINSCGHHHSGHIGILGVDKDGSEWYQVSLGGADG
ncbi:MAG: nitrite/sulfite reductase, partial [Burkholderiaceae bacterium]|nr:nitrite/sulfite reductase [Burkholderiaceae bacterium]